MENYVELEQTIHDIGIRNLAFQLIHYEEMATPLNLISRRFSNLLSSIRLYRDALPQIATKLLGKAHPAIQPLKDLSHDNPAQPMAYRQMEVIRNFSQHVGPPITDITFNRQRDVNALDETTGFPHTTTPRLDIPALSVFRQMAADVRASIVAMDKHDNPMPIIRKYVEHIGTIHMDFRATAKPAEINSEGMMRGLLDRYAKVTPGEKLVAVAVGLENADDAISGVESLVQHRLDYLRYLRVKHLTSANLSMRYVTW